MAPVYALLGAMRLGAARLGYVPGYAFLSIGGVEVAVGHVSEAARTLMESLTITDILNEQPNRCEWTALGTKPTVGQEVLVRPGSVNANARLFAGHIINVQQFYVANKPAAPNMQWRVSVVDYTWQLGFNKVTAFYAEQSATTIAQSLASVAAANGFTATAIEAGLPVVPGGITFTNEDLPQAYSRLAERIGAYWYVDYQKNIHFFLTDNVQNPRDLSPGHPSLANLTAEVNLNDHINRVYVEGRGTSLLGAVLVGDTMIPLVAVDMFTVTAGVFAKASFKGSDGGAQHLTFTGVIAGGTGTLVGPGIGPAAAPSLATAAGTGLGTGTYGYAVTFVTASGESLPSPTATIATGFVTPPSTGASLSVNGSGSGLTAGTYKWAYTFVTAAGETTSSPVNTFITAAGDVIRTSNLQLGPSGTTARKIYRTAVNGSQLKYAGTIADNVTTGYNDSLADASLGANIPTSNTATASHVDLTNIPIGGATVTQRKIYRTVVGGAQLKLQSTIADNTSTTITDSTADGSLGANAPTIDTSALPQPDGQALAGSTSLIVAGTGAFQAGGGWAVIGNGEQVIRYTGITASSLTGIPASGVGSITATVNYNSTVTATPMLTGIPASGAGSIKIALTAGDEIYVVVQRDDTTAQATLAARLGGAGIREEWIQDRRLSIAEGQARGDAFLASRPLDATRVRYTCRDTLSGSGKNITVNLASPTNISGVFKIQTVTISNFRPYADQYPTYAVDASAQRFSFEDLLRQRKAG